MLFLLVMRQISARARVVSSSRGLSTRNGYGVKDFVLLFLITELLLYNKPVPVYEPTVNYTIIPDYGDYLMPAGQAILLVITSQAAPIYFVGGINRISCFFSLVNDSSKALETHEKSQEMIKALIDTFARSMLFLVAPFILESFLVLFNKGADCFI